MPEQINREQLKNMTTAEIDAARKAGRLTEIMTTPNPDAHTGYRATGQGPIGAPHDMKDFIAAKQAK